MKKLIVMLITLLALTSSTVMAKTTYATSGVVNLNSATKAELVLLPGVGNAKADAIISYRQQTPFKQKEDLLAIKGVGEKMLEVLSPYLTVNGNTTIKREKIKVK